MNDEHDNAQTDREMLHRFQCGDDSHQHNCRHLETGVIHYKGRVFPATESQAYDVRSKELGF